MSSDVHIDRPGARFGRRDLLRTVAEGTAGAVGDEFLRCLVHHVALAFDAKFAFVAEASDPTGAHVQVISGWFEGDWMAEPFEYDTQGKPCALVVERDVVAFPDALTTRFPEAKPAIDMGLESYLAVCLRASDGTHLGHMAVMDAGPLTAGEDDVAAMRIFASRTAAELERRHQAAALRRSRARVIEAGDTERRRVGRDLHDGAQQRLAVVSNLLTVAQRRLDRGEQPGDVLNQASEELGAAQVEMRDLARGLHPVALSERGLRNALESLTVGAETSVTVDVTEDELPPRSSSPSTSSCPSRSRTRASTPVRARSRCGSPRWPTRSSSRSWTTAAAAPTRAAERACSGWPTGSTRWAAAWRSTARPASGPA